MNLRLTDTESLLYEYFSTGEEWSVISVSTIYKYMCRQVWISWLPVSLQAWELGGGVGVVIGLLYTRTAENTSSQYVHVHKECVLISLKCFFQLRIISTLIFITRTSQHSHTQTKSCVTVGQGERRNAVLLRRKAEQNSTGDCINTQALCCTWRGPTPPPHLCSHRAPKHAFAVPLFMSHSVHIRVNVLKTLITGSW